MMMTHELHMCATGSILIVETQNFHSDIVPNTIMIMNKNKGKYAKIN